MKLLTAMAILLVATSAKAGAWSAAAVPTRIDVVQAGTAGFLVYGTYGNPAGCVVGDVVFVKATHPQYNKMYATALLAFTSGKNLMAYAGNCDSVPWLSVPATTYNILNDTGSLSISN